MRAPPPPARLLRIECARARNRLFFFLFRPFFSGVEKREGLPLPFPLLFFLPLPLLALFFPPASFPPLSGERMAEEPRGREA